MNTQNPWKTIDSRTVYKNPWICVREDNVIRPDGKPGIYGVVETGVACGVVAVDCENMVYLVGQYRYPIKRYCWEIVEGASMQGESPLDTSKRELREEVGLHASNWMQLGAEVHPSNCMTTEVGYLFLATDLKEGTSEPEGTEVLEIRKMPFRQALQMVHSGEITDMLSIVGLLRAERFLEMNKSSQQNNQADKI